MIRGNKYTFKDCTKDLYIWRLKELDDLWKYTFKDFTKDLSIWRLKENWRDI